MSKDSVVLHSYWRSSCSWRVRIALALKNIDYEYKAVNLLKGEQLTDEYKSLNPSAQLPCLRIDNVTLNDSTAIIEYLEETRKTGISLLPSEPADRAAVRSLCMIIATGIQPVQNLKVLKKIGAEGKMEWGKYWITDGFNALEARMAKLSGTRSFGDSLTMADCYLVPQVYNANRFSVDMTPYPTIVRVHAGLVELDAFKKADAGVQPDVPEDTA